MSKVFESPRVLFVCTKFGGRSVLAAHLCNQLSPWGKIAVAASFEPGLLEQGYFRLLNSLGYPIPAEQPPSLFDRFSAGETFDVVIEMCSVESGENCPILHLSVVELYRGASVIENWSLPDLSRILAAKGNPGQVRARFALAAEELESRMKEFVARLARGNGTSPRSAAVSHRS